MDNKTKKFDLPDVDALWEAMYQGDPFERFWADVEAFAEQNRLPTHYVEEEFIIDGELIPVHLKWDEDADAQ